MKDTKEITIDSCLREWIYDEEVVIWGAGEKTQNFLKHTIVKINNLIYDNDKSKAGMEFEEGKYCVEQGEKIKDNVEKDAWILIISNSDGNISEQLTNWGYENLLSLRMLQRQLEIEKGIQSAQFDVCMLESTNFCNARCTFCINPVMKRKKMHMTSEVFDKVIERLLDEKISPKIFRLHCSGEPLVDPELFDKIEKLKNIFPESEVGYTTNFSIATDEMIDKILELKQDYITISLNAVDENEYHSIMSLEFARTVSNINRLIERKKELNGNIEIILSAVADDGDDELIERFENMWRDKDVSVRIMKKGEWLNAEEQEQEKKVGKREYIDDICLFLHRQICILSDGRYGICCFDAEGNMGEMTVFNTGIAESFAQKKAWRNLFYLGKGLPAECRRCSFRR